MSRQAARQQVGVALFPFLAVLICTMGALIVLLVLLVQQARLDATAIRAAKAAEGSESDTARHVRERLEDAKWRQEMLERSRAEKTEELATSRAKLAHLEEHSHRLAAQAKELIDQARAIDDGRTLGDDGLDAARAEAARLKLEIERLKRELENKKKVTSDGQEWYALIPYQGASGTRRRPIYVECTEFGVILQPEGVILRSDDFMGPLGPGNPLDMALRATREHLETTLGDKAGQPYPLLVVRPGGVVAYGAARAAMRAWDDEFGYELVSDDKQLDFGSPDPTLSARLSKAIADARARQATMMAMMPRRYHSEDPPVSAASEPGGPAARRSAGVGGSGMGSDAGGAALSGGGSGALQGGPAGMAGGNAPGATDSGGAGGSPSQRQPPHGSVGSATSSQMPQAARSPTGSQQGASGASSAAGTAGAGAPGASSVSQAAGNSTLGGTPTGTPVPSFTFGEKKNSAGGASKTGSTAKAGSRSGSAKGANWALPNAKQHHIGVTRPIRMTVLPDRIVLAPDQSDSRGAQVVPLAPELTQQNVDQFVTTVQKEVEGWGLAVKDGYWKPVLQAEVAPGAERHFLNLQTALTGSGIDVIRR